MSVCRLVASEAPCVRDSVAERDSRWTHAEGRRARGRWRRRHPTTGCREQGEVEERTQGTPRLVVTCQVTCHACVLDSRSRSAARVNYR